MGGFGIAELLNQTAKKAVKQRGLSSWAIFVLVPDLGDSNQEKIRIVEKSKSDKPKPTPSGMLFQRAETLPIESFFGGLPVSMFLGNISLGHTNLSLGTNVGMEINQAKPAT